MDASQVLATLIGLGLMGFVAWFFFGAPHRVGGGATPTAGTQQVGGRVKEGSTPAAVDGPPVVK